ncbi:MAG TPA: exodeoxyribonuclease VII large subunit [Metalysinibacillus jejuensis]|uniref:Exodeoxyribonuclease 7 large subunit n=1 Tax=Metalysinibacillus jejuensis TaxID=914327 RepID=A0A921NBN8_9BACL|nr:exodeoxyribonuclease VII large subunit [Metalysinibacillus jejuensis]HJH11079.1 exodeoxyribonuclease VII large subunit [Metalysinibacillus jejuensis]
MPSYLTVQALTQYIKRKFDVDPHLRKVYVQGELSNVKHHPSGHIYFVLKDGKSQISAVMFKKQASQLVFRPESGMKVFICGDVTVYENYGSYQLYANEMLPDGAGALFIAFQQLQQRLQQEGLFNISFKQAIPKYPKAIGVVTAPTGAAVRDICTTLQRRYPQAAVFIYPAVVQGKQAAPNIVEKIKQANDEKRVDVLIVGRGGGSIEDLWAFNEENVARAIFESKIPIISAVGHETDTTIADFVADLRAPTPTAAAELATPDYKDLQAMLRQIEARLSVMMRQRLTEKGRQLQALQQSYILQDFTRVIRPFVERLSYAEQRLPQVMQLTIWQHKQTLQQLLNRLQPYEPRQKLQAEQLHLLRLQERLTRAVDVTLQQAKERLTYNARTLGVLNPLQTIGRGFQLTYKEETPITSVAQLALKDEIRVQFKDGHIKATITEIVRGKDDE